MKKKVVSLFLASLMVVSMGATPALAAENAFNDPAGDNKLEGNSGLQDVTYRVVVPTDLEFAIDPFEQAGKSQVWSEDLTITNKSNVPVKVDVAVSVADNASVDGEVEFVTSEDAVTETDDSKIMYFAAEVATAVTETKAAEAALESTNTVYTDGNGNYSMTQGDPFTTEVKMTDVESVAVDYTDGAKVMVDGTQASELTFALAGADYATYDNSGTTEYDYITTAADNAGSASFRFSGAVNSTADWQAEEVTATVVYDFLGLTADNYTTMAESATQGYVPVQEAPTFRAGTGLGEITFTKGVGDDALASITKVEMTNEAGTFDGYAAYEGMWKAAELDMSAGKLTLDAGYTSCYTNEKTDAVITYTTVGGDTKTTTVEAVITTVAN